MRVTVSPVMYSRRPQVEISLNCTNRHILDEELKVNAAHLIHLAERITREVILLERVRASKQKSSGFSGLIMPRSWARNLVSSSRRFEVRRESPKTEFLEELMPCLGEIIIRLRSGIPST